MAERNYLNEAPGVPIDADIVEFAGELIRCLMFRLSPVFIGEREANRPRAVVYNVFDDTIRYAVCFINDLMAPSLSFQYHLEFDNCMVDANTLRVVADAKTLYFVRLIYAQGFKAVFFLVYCTIMSNLAVYFFSRGVFIAADIVHFHISYVLQYFLPADRWIFIHRAAETLENISWVCCTAACRHRQF